MSEKCWFCEKIYQESGNEIEFPLLRIIENRNSGKKNRYAYESSRISIPRCGKCSEAHVKVKKAKKHGQLLVLLYFSLNILTFLGWLSGQNKVLIVWGVLVVPLILLAILWGPPALNTKRFLQSAGTLPESDKNMYPELIEKLSQGFKISTNEEIEQFT